MLVTTGEAARQLGVSVDTIRRWDHEGLIKAIRIPNNQRRIPQSEINRIRGQAPAA